MKSLSKVLNLRVLILISIFIFSACEPEQQKPAVICTMQQLIKNRIDYTYIPDSDKFSFKLVYVGTRSSYMIEGGGRGNGANEVSCFVKHLEVEESKLKVVGIYDHSGRSVVKRLSDVEFYISMLVHYTMEKSVHTAADGCEGSCVPQIHKESTNFNKANFIAYLKCLKPVHDKWKSSPKSEEKDKATLLRSMMIKVFNAKIEAIEDAVKNKQERGLHSGNTKNDFEQQKAMLKNLREGLERKGEIIIPK